MDLAHKSLGLGRKPALLVVDMINGFTDPSSPLGCSCADVVVANATLLRQFRVCGLPVYYTTVVYHHERQARIFRQRLPALNVLTPDSHWVQVDERLAMQVGDELIEKQWASAFHQTDLAQRLRQRGVDSLVVTGLTTSGCVRATAVDGLQYDYPVVIPREAVGDRNVEAHRANMHDLQSKYADVMSVAELVDTLAEQHRHAHGSVRIAE